jgi:ribosomal protein L34E
MEMADYIEDVEDVEAEAEYTLEAPVKCASCNESLNNVNVVRLLRTRVNFTSSLPRRGYVVVCPSCRTVVPAGLG